MVRGEEGFEKSVRVVCTSPQSKNGSRFLRKIVQHLLRTKLQVCEVLGDLSCNFRARVTGFSAVIRGYKKISKIDTA